MKIALVCDWLTNVGGAEKVLLKIHQMYPEAPIYTSQYNPKKIDWFRDADVRTGWLQKFPMRFRRILGPLRQKYFSKLDLSDYDLVISVTGAEAKAVKCINEKTGKKAMHISYCHVPTQYYWQMYDDYVKDPGFGILNPFAKVCLKILVGPLKKKDFEAAKRVDQFVTISEYAKRMIKKYYKREAVVVCPPVEIEEFRPDSEPVEDYYVTTSRQVTWKRLDLAVAACKELGRPLLVVGEGPEHKKLVRIAGGDTRIKFLSLLSKKELAKILVRAKGYLFPSIEPFGIAPVEALSTGCPVIALNEGGARDYVINGENGILFSEQTVESLKRAILKFEKLKFSRKEVSRTARKFGEVRFEKELRKVVDEVAQ